MEISFVKNGDNDIWVAFDAATGKTLGKVTRVTRPYGKAPVYQVWIGGVHDRDIAQGQPHVTLGAAQDDLRSFF